MKKLSLIIVILIFCYVSASSQSCLPEGITFYYQSQVDNFNDDYPGCNEIEGNVYIFGLDINNLSGLSVLTAINGNLHIQQNSPLTLSGLDNINSIGGSLIIAGLSLSDFTGLNNLKSIGGDLFIVANYSLKAFFGLENLISVGNLIIKANNSLTTLNGLENLTSIPGYISIFDNDSLINLSGIGNVDPNSIHSIGIFNNISLSSCEALSICSFLSISFYDVQIYDNAIGCNSREELEEDCADLFIEEIIDECNLFLYPNPAKSEINVIIEGARKEINKICVFALTGQRVLRESKNKSIDISGLQPGMYIVEVTIDNTRLRQKLLVLR